MKIGIPSSSNRCRRVRVVRAHRLPNDAYAAVAESRLGRLSAGQRIAVRSLSARRRRPAGRGRSAARVRSPDSGSEAWSELHTEAAEFAARADAVVLDAIQLHNHRAAGAAIHAAASDAECRGLPIRAAGQWALSSNACCPACSSAIYFPAVHRSTAHAPANGHSAAGFEHGPPAVLAANRRSRSAGL